MLDWTTLGLDPNQLHPVPLSLIDPNPDNCRLFIERTPLAKLEAIYRAYAKNPFTVLPDPPILQLLEDTTGDPHLRLLAGERRITAALAAHVLTLPCRVTRLQDEDAYRFLLDHNDVVALTTVERAYRAAEMSRLGFSASDIRTALGGVAVHRYLLVGELLEPDWFTDDPKLCDPSIVEWHEAALYGEVHFKRCFDAWNAGLWDAKRCAREFRRRGTSLPLDNAEKGFRVTKDGSRIVVRGQLDLDLVAPEDGGAILELLEREIGKAATDAHTTGAFGRRSIVYINPDTISDTL